jgi:hypothetical protein
MPFDNPPRTPFGDIELLWDARSRILSRDHWTQGRFEDGDRHCLIGVLSLVSGCRSFNVGNRVERRLMRSLARNLPATSEILGMKFFTARWRVICFNDDPETGHGDVIALIDRTISQLASQAPALSSTIAPRSAAVAVSPDPRHFVASDIDQGQQVGIALDAASTR